jgi:hypothetical protein
MTWGQGSNIPARIKAQVRRRDKVCQLQYPGVCVKTIQQFDHIDGLADTGQQRYTVTTATILQGVCAPCHKVKTEGQRLAGIERAKSQRGGLSRRLRDIEPHPFDIAAGQKRDKPAG